MGMLSVVYKWYRYINMWDLLFVFGKMYILFLVNAQPSNKKQSKITQTHSFLDLDLWFTQLLQLRRNKGGWGCKS
jgi:hypothetical protein